MKAKEMALTGLALSALAVWELSIGEIPLGLFSIRHAGQANLFNTIIVLKLLTCALLLSRGLLRLDLPFHRPLVRLRFALYRDTHAAETKHGRP